MTSDILNSWTILYNLFRRSMEELRKIWYTSKKGLFHVAQIDRKPPVNFGYFRNRRFSIGSCDMRLYVELSRYILLPLSYVELVSNFSIIFVYVIIKQLFIILDRNIFQQHLFLNKKSIIEITSENDRFL